MVDGMSEFTEDIGQKAKQIGEQVGGGTDWLCQKVDGRARTTPWDGASIFQKIGPVERSSPIM